VVFSYKSQILPLLLSPHLLLLLLHPQSLV
jgi:hypothetical protein